MNDVTQLYEYDNKAATYMYSIAENIPMHFAGTCKLVKYQKNWSHKVYLNTNPITRTYKINLYLTTKET